MNDRDICDTCGQPESAHEVDPCARAMANPEVGYLRAEVARLTQEYEKARKEIFSLVEENADYDHQRHQAFAKIEEYRGLVVRLASALREECDWCRAAGGNGCDDHCAALDAAAKLLPSK